MKVVKKYEIRRLILSEIDSINDNCIRDCNSNYYHTFRFTLEKLKILQIKEILTCIIYKLEI